MMQAGDHLTPRVCIVSKPHIPAAIKVKPEACPITCGKGQAPEHALHCKCQLKGRFRVTNHSQEVRQQRELIDFQQAVRIQHGLSAQPIDQPASEWVTASPTFAIAWARREPTFSNTW